VYDGADYLTYAALLLQRRLDMKRAEKLAGELLKKSVELRALADKDKQRIL
jgi:hypothetical protein